MFSSEINGLAQAVAALTREGILDPGIVVGAVDIRKGTTDHLRIAEGPSLGQLDNPTVGSPYVVGQRDGIVCTTGRPFQFPGTAHPLAAVISYGDLEIAWVLEDIYALSQPVLTAPDKCARLPITIRLADDFLEPIASTADEHAALYDVEPDGDDTDDEVDSAVPALLAHQGR